MPRNSGKPAVDDPDVLTRQIRLGELGLPLEPGALATIGGRLWPGRAEVEQVLYVRGTVPPLGGLAIVGTRQPTSEAAEFARRLVTNLAAHGYAIWSGGAKGIDCAAHEAALAAGAPTVVVSPSGLECPYPPEHVPLFERVVESGGALVSLWPDRTQPCRPWFHKRNQLLAALTLATVVVQAPLRSGARSAAKAARRFGRPLCVVPHPPWSDKGAGCALELAQGARPVASAADVLRAIGGPLFSVPAVVRVRAQQKRAVERKPPAEPPRAPAEPEAGPPLDREEQALTEILDEQPRHLDQLCVLSGLPYATVARALLTLTLRAIVVQGPAGHFRRRRA
jgi:DNA processing protein